MPQIDGGHGKPRPESRKNIYLTGGGCVTLGRMCVSTVGVVQSKKHCRLDGGIPSSTHCPPMRSPLSLPSPLQSQPHNNPRRTKSLTANQRRNRTGSSRRESNRILRHSAPLCYSARTETVPLGRLKRGGGRLEEEGTLFELRRKGGSRRKAGGAAGCDMKPASVCFALLRCVCPLLLALPCRTPNQTQRRPRYHPPHVTQEGRPSPWAAWTR
jgi:hypothetical protein